MRTVRTTDPSADEKRPAANDPLVLEALRGGKRARNALFKREEPELRAYAEKKLGGRHTIVIDGRRKRAVRDYAGKDVDDVLQDTMTDAGKNMNNGKYKPGAQPFINYLQRILSRRVVDRFRAAAIAEFQGSVEVGEGSNKGELIILQPDPQPTPGADVRAQDRERRLKDALKALPPDSLELVCLYVECDCNDAELARRRGYHRATVGRRLKTILKKLLPAIGSASPESLKLVRSFMPTQGRVRRGSTSQAKRRLLAPASWR